MTRDTLLATATAAKSGSTVTALIDGVVTTIQAVRDLTIASGDVLVVVKIGSQWFAVGRAYTAAPTPPINGSVPTPGGGTSGITPFSPIETRSYRNGAWRTDNPNVYQGQYGGGGNHTGAVFYGDGPRSLAGATVLDASILVRRGAGGAYAAQATTMRLMTNATRPAGAPTLTSSTAGPNIAQGVALTDGFGVPAAWAQAIVDGTAGGLAFFDGDGSPYVIFDGRGTWGPAFTLNINWRR